jgi:hypothetical protein
MAREELSTDIPLPAPRPKRQTAAEKAKALLNESRASEAYETRQERAGDGKQADAKPVITYKMLAGRVFAEQYEWFCQVPKSWRARHPRKPKLTREELMRIAIEHLRDSEDDLDVLIERYRSS